MELKEKILDVIRGSHVSAVATVGERGMPAARHMVLSAFDDLLLAGSARVDSAMVADLRRTPHAGIAIWSGKEFTDPYVQVQASVGVHADRETKRKYWDPAWEQYLGPADNPDLVVLVFRPDSVSYFDPKALVSPEVWRRE